MLVTWSNMWTARYIESTPLKNTNQVKPITPMLRTQSSTYHRPNLIELKKQRYLNTPSGSVGCLVNIIA